MHDITESSKIEKERKDFVSNVSHELRTPLTSVNSYIDTLVDGSVDKKTAQSFLNVAKEETQRMIRMITDLLELSRMDQGTLEVNSEYINLPKFLNYTLDRFDHVLKTDKNAKKCEIVREYGDDVTFVEVDQDKFAQVIDNIINNAIKYSPDGGKIKVNIEKTETRAMISIADEGLGIPKKDLNNIFGRFYRVDKARARAQGGSGLGLAISKEVIEVLDGRIWADSVEGSGSTFYISLPFINQTDDNWS
jgi:two-component system sensor histidine kinase VicK